MIRITCPKCRGLGYSDATAEGACDCRSGVIEVDEDRLVAEARRQLEAPAARYTNESDPFEAADAFDLGWTDAG